MIKKPPKQRALLYRLDELPANSLVDLYVRCGHIHRGFISGVGVDDLIDLYDHSTLIPDDRHTVIDGADLIAFRTVVLE